MVARHVGADHVAGGVAYVVAVVDEPGHIRHTAADRLVFGEPDGRTSARLRAFQEAGQRSGFVADLSSHIDVDLWVKFVRLGTWSGMTAATRSPMGVIRQHHELLEMMDRAFDEAMAVGRARGITFPDGLVEGTQQMVRNFPHESKSSMLEDLERGRRLELPWLSGGLVRMGRESGVPTPTHGFINAVLCRSCEDGRRPRFARSSSGRRQIGHQLPPPAVTERPHANVVAGVRLAVRARHHRFPHVYPRSPDAPVSLFIGSLVIVFTFDSSQAAAASRVVSGRTPLRCSRAPACITARNAEAAPLPAMAALKALSASSRLRSASAREPLNLRAA